MADRHNIVFEQGATFERTINWKDPQGNPIDLTGYRVRMQVRQSPAATTKLVDFDSDALAAGMHIDALDTTGVIHFWFDPSVTSALDFQNAEYDLTVTSAGGFTYRLLEGKASVSPGVTR